MKINLRKANAIQQEIGTAIKALNVKSQISLSEFEDPASVILKSAENLKSDLADLSSLISALFEIRTKTAHANISSGISDHLAQIAEIEMRISTMRGVTTDDAVRMDENIINGRISKIKSAPVEIGMRHYGMSDDTILTGILTQDEVNAYKSEISGLKREKRDIQDKLLGLNVTTEITISDYAAAVLNKAGII